MFVSIFMAEKFAKLETSLTSIFFQKKLQKMTEKNFSIKNNFAANDESSCSRISIPSMKMKVDIFQQQRSISFFATELAKHKVDNS